MKNPIPADWDGESWKRYAICWPDSALWTGLLLGFLSYCQRGRSWKEDTGSVIGAQAIGNEIWSKNYPLEEVFMSCSEGQMVARSILFLAAVVGGFNITTIEDGIPENFFASVNFTTLGLANRIGDQTLSSGPNTIQATLERLKVSVDDLTTALASAGATGEDLEDDLAKVWGALDDITTILGGDPSDPPDPL